MPDYIELYSIAKQRYNSASDGYARVNNQIGGLENDKIELQNAIACLTTEISNNETALSGVKDVLLYRTQNETWCSNIISDTADVSEIYNLACECSPITNKSWSIVFSEEETNTKNTVEECYSSLEEKKNKLEDIIEGKKKEKAGKKDDLKTVNKTIRTLNSDRNEYDRIKKSAAADMAEYKKYIPPSYW